MLVYQEVKELTMKSIVKIDKDELDVFAAIAEPSVPSHYVITDSKGNQFVTKNLIEFKSNHGVEGLKVREVYND